MSTRRERLENRLSRRLDWATKANARSLVRFRTVDAIGEHIPMGQPILVGHHSECHARRDAARIESNIAAGVAENKLAEHHGYRAAGIQRQLDTSIFSDDADAIERLQEKIAKAELRQERMKAVNAAIRRFKKKGEEAQVAALVTLDLWQAREDKIPEAIARQLLKPDFAGRIGIASYELTNNNANIRRMKERVEEIKARNVRAEKAAVFGVLIEGGEYVSVTFPEKPDREVLDALRAAGFFWSQGSWGGRRDKLPACVLEMVEK